MVFFSNTGWDYKTAWSGELAGELTFHRKEKCPNYPNEDLRWLKQAKRQQRRPTLSHTFGCMMSFVKSWLRWPMWHLVYVLLKVLKIITTQECARGSLCISSNKTSSSILLFLYLNWNWGLDWKFTLRQLPVSSAIIRPTFPMKRTLLKTATQKY